MLKKLFTLAFAALALAGCNDDDDDAIRYARTNDLITEEGYITGSNLHFYGTSTVTDASGGTFIDKNARFEFAGASEEFALYMHKTRFAAAMPGVEMRLYRVPYTPAGNKSMTFTAERIIPDALKANETGGGASYQPVERYLITALEGRIDDTACRVSFTCAGVFDVVFEGRLIVSK